jgi:uncharacterized protein YqhQ
MMKRGGRKQKMMKKSSEYLRWVARLLLLPFVQGAEEVLVGGQAVIEGVMMRSPHAYAVAVRTPSGSIAVTRQPVNRPSEKHPWLKLPFLRGLGVLGQALAIGIRALRYSTQEAFRETGASDTVSQTGKAEAGNWLLALNLVFSLGFFVVFYKFLPLYAATWFSRHAHIHNFILFNLADGIIRLGLFLGMLIALAQAKEMKRVFEYHGAEHKVVWAFEKTGRMELEDARKATRFHPRCGTSFLLVVMVIALVVYLFIPFQAFVWKLVTRILLLPVVVGASYEFIRYAAKSQGRVWRCSSQPGLWLQRVTTREPDDSQIETAIKALESAMDLEKARGGELVVA